MTSKRHKVLDDIIPIVVSSDDNYAQHLGVMAASLLENTTQPDRCHFFIIDGGINPRSRAIIEDEISKRKGKLDFLNVDQAIYANFPIRRGLSSAAYYRISIPDLFDETVRKVIYLDCDLIVKDDIVGLWSFPLAGKHIAAVEDISNSTFLTSGVPQKEYFNSGVMVIDLHRWREDNIPEKVRDEINRQANKINNDQDALNCVLHSTWTRLPLRWNLQSGLYRAKNQRKHFTAEDIDLALWDPGIIHFIGWAKPWNYLCFHPLVGEYDRYLHQTAWVGTIKKNTTTLNILRKYLNPSLIKKWLRQKRWQRRYKKRGISLFRA